ncbi:hypothetical protein PISMIDRAFT_629560 [Pisolithus microcarpus 441]|uniref:RRM domain-containing protein n=1 Tax=Pisolithus microcarpus 441 TaxID=765257 RepID=A0A0C9XZS3_9AGAM|nr:hypothetical protein PISMIDRAFT_629560 [Pisolithus microcarpus 441]
MSSARKLTKREKKGIAFRDRRQGKKGRKSTELESPDNDVPILEYQVLAESGISLPQREEGDEPSTGFFGDDRAGNTREGPARVVGSKKRKGETSEKAQGTGEQPDRPQRKRRKGPDGEPVVDVERVVDAEESDEKESGESKQRFILFLDPPPTVRLLTLKPSKSKLTPKLTTKSKGCAFLEFQNKHALQRALKLHHSELEGRKINVELTAGGGGKGETRLRRVKDRNKELEGQRVRVLRLDSLDST